MFRQMRRFKQQMTEEQCLEILEKETNGVLALEGDNGYPYSVPLSFVYKNGKIYFHSAVTGHKTDCIKRNPKASFCVVSEDNIIPEKFTTAFKSVIAFGQIRIISEEAEKINALIALSEKYSPEEGQESMHKEINSSLKNVAILEFTIDHLTGKQAKELL